MERTGEGKMSTGQEEVEEGGWFGLDVGGRNQDGGKEKCEPEGRGGIVIVVSGTLPHTIT